MSLVKEKRITKSNYLIESKYKITVIQAKILTELASVVQPTDEDFKRYKFNIKELLEHFGMNKKNHTDIKTNTKSLISKVFELYEDGNLVQIAFLSSAKYFEKEGYVELEFSPRLKPYLLNLKSYLTSYKESNVLSLTSFYSIRLYELLKQYETIGKRTFIVDELRQYLGIETKQYTRYNDFKRKVILQAYKELKAKCDIYFEFEEHKTGRKITSITFTIISKHKSKSKQPLKGQLQLEVPQIQEPQAQPKKQTIQKEINYHLLEKLTNLGVIEKVAKQLLNENSEFKISSNIDYTLSKNSKGKIKDLSAYLVKAIKQDYYSNKQEDYKPQDQNRRQSTGTKETRELTKTSGDEKKVLIDVADQEQLIKNKFEAYKSDKVRTFLEENNDKRNEFIKEFIQKNHREKPVKLIIDFMEINIKNIDNSKIEKLRTILNNPNEHFKVTQVGLKLASKTFKNLFVDYILISKLHLTFEIYKSIIKS